MLVLVPEQRGQRLDAGGQARVGGLHLPAQPRDQMHGRVQGVFVDQVAIVADKGQDAVQAPGFEHSTCLPGANQLQDLYTLFSQVFACPGCDVSNNEAVAHGLDGALDGSDPAGALGGHIEVVGDGARCHLEDVVRRALVQEDAAEGWQEGPWRAAFKAPVDVVGHEQQHAQLLEGDELHVALLALPHLQPLQQRLGVHVSHHLGDVSADVECSRT